MKDLRSTCWRFHRKIAAAIVLCSAIYFITSILITKRTMTSEDAQGSLRKTFYDRGGTDERDAGTDHHRHHHRKNSSRKIHRLPHNPLPGEGIKGLAHRHGNPDEQREDEFSSSSTSSSADNLQQSAKKASKPSKKFPDAIIIGVKKGGTRALLEFIDPHPDVRVAQQEVHFFDRHYEKGLDWYREQMPLSKPGQITIEKTPSYYITENAPERIRELGKEVKLIVVVRDPVIRAISDFAQSVATGRRKPEEFDRLAVPDPRTGAVDGDWYAVHVSMYDVHLERWLRFFPRSQFLFINGDELIKNPAPQLIRLQEFLRIDTIIDERSFVFNATKGFYCVKRMADGEDIVKCLGDNKGRPHPRVSPSVLRNMRLFFRPHMDRFYGMVGENFHWGSEEGR